MTTKTREIVGHSKDVLADVDDSNQILFLINQRLNKHNDRISNLEDTMRINGTQELKIRNTANRRVVKWLNGKKSNAYSDNSIRGTAFSRIYHDLKNAFDIPRYGELPAKEYESGLKYVANWEPDYDLKIRIEEVNKN